MDDNGIKDWTDKRLIYWEFLQKMTQLSGYRMLFLVVYLYHGSFMQNHFQKPNEVGKCRLNFYSHFDKMSKLWKLDVDFICQAVQSKIPFEKLVAHSLSIYLKRESKQKCWKLNGEVLPRLKFCLIARTGASVGIR